ncbi:MAG: hypothetical protein PWQ87_583 [Candidatus Woesearchaeota archaeon]|nr:hypothetical protein [Candidatus Woesearchaeota archaeon]
MKDLEEYVKEVDKLYNSLDENTLRKPIGSKIFEKSQNIEDFINESYVNLNDYKESEDHSAKRAWYSLYLINDNLSWLIKELEYSKEELPNELVEFKETTAKYLIEYRGEARYDTLKEAKEDKRIGNIDHAIDLLNSDISELRDNSKLYGNMPPLEESVNLLKDLVSERIDHTEKNKGKRSQEFYKSILKKLDKFY